MRLLPVVPLLALSIAACGDASGNADVPDTVDTVDTDTASPDTVDTADAADTADDTSPDTAQPDTIVPDTRDTQGPDTTPSDPSLWKHVGAITTAAAPAATFPLFANRASAIPSGLTLPEGRAMVVDFDVDGRDDLVVLGTSVGMKPIFLRNATPRGSSDWAFEDVTAQAGMDASMVLLVFGDLDNDGDPDAFSGTSFRSGADGKHGIWLNDGRGHFSYLGNNGLASNKVGSRFKEMAAATLADFDKDGRLDLYVAMWNVGDLAGNFYLQTADELYRGDGTGVFASFPLPDQHNPLTSQMDPSYAGVPRRGYGLCPADFDDDGDLDLFVNNYGAGRPAADDPPHYWEWNFLWRNDGAMAFTDVGEAAKVHATIRGIGGVQREDPVVYDGKTYPGPIGGNGFGCSWGDFDNDGDLDLAVGQIAHPDYPQTDRLMLHVNPGGEPGSARVFTEESMQRGLEYYEDELHPVFVDVDNDGRLDLAVSRLRGGSKWEVYLQTADKKFGKRTWAESGVDITQPGPTLWLDVDQDGDLDFFMPKTAGGTLFENTAAHGHWLAIELVGTAPRDATGARITLESAVGKQVREVIGGTGHYNTQQSRREIFGLGGDSGAANVVIRWPDGEIQTLGDVKANLHLRVYQGVGVQVVDP